MRIKAGQTVKVHDIGTPGEVISTRGGEAILRFEFPEETIETAIPISLIDRVLSEGVAA